MPKKVVDWKVDFSAIGELVGTVDGISEGVASPSYMEGLIKDAHAKAAEEFDAEVATVAQTGYLSHVYEFGTAGVTAGPARFDPTSQAARLWSHGITGHGGVQDIFFTFRPAVQPNPQPTVASTGVASKYLRKLSRRKYIFRNRAMVMETGNEVEIRPKNGNFLFVPFYGEQPRNPLNKRGFMMWDYSKNGPIVATPGNKSQGTFSAFWQTWWRSRGYTSIQESMYEDFNKDVAYVFAKTRKNGGILTPPTTKLNTAAARRRAKSALTRAANKRRSERVNG